MTIDAYQFRTPTLSDYQGRLPESVREVAPDTGYHALFALCRIEGGKITRRSPRGTPNFLKLGAVLHNILPSQGIIEMTLRVPHQFEPIQSINGSGKEAPVRFRRKPNGFLTPVSQLSLGANELRQESREVMPTDGYLLYVRGLAQPWSDDIEQFPSQH